MSEGRGKVYGVLHGPHRRKDKGLILLPISPNNSRSFQTMRKGDSIVFEGDDTEREIVAVAKVNMNSSIAEFLCNFIYGRQLSAAIERWESNAVALGESRDSISKDYCMAIYYKNDEEA